jgi:soluble lytic murein transglycosylase-like protein
MNAALRQRLIRISGAVVLALVAGGAAVYFIPSLRERVRAGAPDHWAFSASATPAPRDLAAQRAEFMKGIESLQKGDARDAIRHFRGTGFGEHAVEEYRLYLLANAHQLAGDPERARLTLAQLWRRRPELVYRDDVAFTLSTLYASKGAWHEAAAVHRGLAGSTAEPAISAASRAEQIRLSFRAGDPGSMLFAARSLVLQNPRSPEARTALDVERRLREIPDTSAIPLTIQERAVRGENLLRDGDPEAALRELAPIDAESLGSPLRERILLARGNALQRTGRCTDAIQTVTPLFSGHFKHAIPAIELAARCHRAIAAGINPTVTKQVKQTVRAGTRKVKRKGKTVTVPRYRIVTKSVKVVNQKLKKKRDEQERLQVERLKDILGLPAPPPVRKEALTALIRIAQSRNQDDYMRELITDLAAIDPATEAGLQRFWDKAWAAYVRGDHATARPLLQFVSTTYRNPNMTRQARYWYARAIERGGEKGRAREIYDDLVSVHYEDLYSKFAAARGGTPRESALATRPKAPEWSELAEKEMPDPLRLAYELSALGASQFARAEIQQKASDENRMFADALLGDIFNTLGSADLANRYARRAFPDLATVEQDSVPAHFVEMYYPLRFEDEIREYAAKRKLDPYLVMALIRQESAYDPSARSSAGAVGLMQIMPATGRELGLRFYRGFTNARLSNPKVNIELGTYYLRQVINLLDGNVELALAGYNGGPYRIRRLRAAARRKPLDEFIESIPMAESRNYVKRLTLLRSSYYHLHGR